MWIHVVEGPRLVRSVPLGELPWSVGSHPGCDLSLQGEEVPSVAGSLGVGGDGTLGFTPEGAEEGAPFEVGSSVAVGPYRLFLEKRGEKDQQEVLELLLDLLPKLWSADESEVLTVLLEALLELFGAEWGSFLRETEGEGPPEVLATAGRRSTPGDTPSRTVLKKLRDAEAPVLALEVDDPQTESIASLPTEVRSVIAARLPDDEGGGLVYLESPVSQRRYSQGEHELLKRLCALAGDHLSRARGARAVESQKERLAEIHRIEMRREHDLGHIVGQSESMQEVFRLVRQAAESEVTTLILGESGTGKELVAKAIHGLSPRKKNPFVAVNCAALPYDLVESELFGHVKGAFSGAHQTRLGRFEMADGGTLFLDELGELPIPQQVKLLRALQERVVQRVGEGKERPVDVHLITATNADLRTMVGAGLFREDLYFRVSVFGIDLPPLRERMDDLPHLIQHFVRQFNPTLKRNIRKVHPQALEILKKHDWPGNIRELRNVVQQAMVRSEGEVLTPESLSLMGTLTLGRPAGSSATHRAIPDPLDGMPDELEEAKALWESRFLKRALEVEDGNVNAAAKRLGVSRANLYRKLSMYDIEAADYRK